MSAVVFVDTETTGLDPATEQTFEVALIHSGREVVYRIQPDAHVVAAMHAKAVEVNRYHERTRHPDWRWDDPVAALRHAAALLDGRHLVGAVPDFDARHLTATYRRFGVPVPRWHYHLIDVEALAVGYLHGVEGDLTGTRAWEDVGDSWRRLPWDSEALSRAVGVDPPDGDERHTALADARWAQAVYEAVVGR